MRNKLLGSLAAVLVVLALPAGVLARPATTDVTGVVYNNSAPVDGAAVLVVCKGHARADETDSHGSYLVAFPAKQCPVGSIVEVTAKFKGGSGFATGKVSSVTTKLNIGIVNISVPEMGAIGLAVAGVGSVGFVAWTRRRGVQSNRVV